MWEPVIAGAGGLMGLYVAIRLEVRRSHELLQKDISHLDRRVSYLDGRFDHVDGRFNHLDGRFDHLDGRFDHLDGRVDGGLTEVRADIRRLDQKIDAVRGELIGFLGGR